MDNEITCILIHGIGLLVGSGGFNRDVFPILLCAIQVAAVSG